MKIETTRRFEKEFRSLSIKIKNKALKQILLLEENPSHPSLDFKKLKGSKNEYQFRVDYKFRILGILNKGSLSLFWIGPHKK
ncbi:MAG: hypothetical protein IIB40_11835 [Candidatus Marinimicrobia bacterium]|nr:hypothetical protein [Candidatus Neomarinimicrobiota bacterium]